MPRVKYGINWPDDKSDLDIEFTMIQGGGTIEVQGQQRGLGLFEHYRNAERIAWPEDYEHRWTDLVLKTILNNDVSVFFGPGDAGKTYPISKFLLIDWWAFSERTLWLVSSTELRGAELRIWGTLKQLFNRGRERFPNLPGNVLESHHAITTEQIDKKQQKARLLTKGLIFIPCLSNNRYVGMGKFVGIKPPPNGRLGHCGDEVQAMEHSFVDAYSNWYGKPNFRGIMSGNPVDLDDCLCFCGEPVEGWSSWKDTGKTQEWRSKFYDAQVVALDGRDSPNFDQDHEKGVKFPLLIGPKKIKAVEKTHGKDSWQYFNQCVGKPRPGIMVRRVITLQLCEEYGAFDDVNWGHEGTTRIAYCDAAYGGVGGDDCIVGHIEFGKDVEGNSVLACNPPVLVPVSIAKKGLPEEQIGNFVKDYCESFDIPPENFFFDARATMAITFARIWSPQVNAVDFGGVATNRPVSMDTYIWDGDTQSRRLQLCSELYSKFVTELWFTVYYVIVSNQMRRLPREVAAEGAKREWKYGKGGRMEVETKADMKLRTRHSPDRFDGLVVGIEGARRRGFEIRSMGKVSEGGVENFWLENEVKKHKEFLEKTSLNYA